MSLLGIDAFSSVFSKFSGQTVGFVRLDGNVGDYMIHEAANQLMGAFDIRYRVVKPAELKSAQLENPLDHILVSGGGNMGGMYPRTQKQRRRTLALGVPVSVLPQSFTDSTESIGEYARVFVRERASLGLNPGTILAPDLALGLRYPWIDEGVDAGTGIWLRQDGESVVEDRSLSLGDPIVCSLTIYDYFGLASKFERIVTDRLHFAIAAMLIGRQVILLPNSYAKNRSMYETWLRDLGCRWRFSLGNLKSERDDISRRLWKRLCAPPSVMTPWNERPRLVHSVNFEATANGGILRSEAGEEVPLPDRLIPVVSLCDGNWTVEDIASELAVRDKRSLLCSGGDVQTALMELRRRSIVYLASDIRKDKPASRLWRKDKVIEVEVLPVKRRRGRLRSSALVRNAATEELVHYFEYDARWRDIITKRADPFVLALLPQAMRDGAKLRIVGAPVDARLLDNLEEYQRAWQAWRPESMSAIEIEAEEEIGNDRYDRPSLMAFSGGVDSMYTLFRLQRERDGYRDRRLEAAVMIQGFDIPVYDRRGFSAAVEQLRPVTAEAGVDLIEVTTNVRATIQDFNLEHGPALASVLSLFGRRYGAGFVASTAPYRCLFPWGSNAVTDGLLGGSFRILHDGAAVLRLEKIRALMRWPTAISRLRVCWENRDVASNCGRCPKCFNLSMALQSLGAPLDCFATPPRAEDMAYFVDETMAGHLALLDFSCILEEARLSGLNESWVDALTNKLAN